ncbi:MAG: FIG056333: sensor [uncultured Sphingosinicella sp.]|uniref:histidine kinase n=1 Tax=uncultured Sphingosinicella sp. TaxID=478748 RepID=A0A6J4TLC7_9SPHN|nr:PAS domain-containing sensor histidine kinase [uncultured Sphingosinicella sp.]CAA9526362.1 MAG: FIG056333: sensor [uncultured Sphingosinicella sp.]
MGSLEISRNALVLIALVCGLWLAISLWALIAGFRQSRDGRGREREAREAEALLAAAPIAHAIVFDDHRLASGQRLADLLGLTSAPLFFGSLSGEGSGLSQKDLDALGIRVRETAAAGGSFSLPLRPQDSSRILRVEGGPAPPPYPTGAVLLWFEDATIEEEQTGSLGAEVERLGSALGALSGLIEAAPFPMWHRGPDLRLAMVNSAYVAAVEAQDGMAVIKAGIELVDESEGRTPLSQAAAVREKGQAVARTVPATIAGERRMMRVVEVPLGATGVAGYAIDVEELEQAHTDLARFVRAQRDMLDRLSAGVAQFGRDRGLIFYNQPFARLFSLRPDFLADMPEFNRVLDSMRETGNLPEVRDYPDWKQERGRWFTSGLAAHEEDWLLPRGKHLRVVAQPLPDGGLLLIFEDRTEQIQLASARDTLLRVRTATFDNLFEAVGVFASDGRLHLWNNRFREIWEFEEEQLAAHPRVDLLTPHIAGKLKNPSHAGIVRELVRSATVERKQRSGRVSLADGRDFEFAAVPLPDGNALFTMLDITSSRIIETALRERNEALEDADRLKTAFVSNMSYELRTPLTSIGGFAEMLAEGYAGELPPQAGEYVLAILQSVSRLGALIDNVLDLTQSDSGSLLLAEDAVDLRALTLEGADGVRGEAAESGIEFAVEIDASLGSITGDRRRLGQAIGNVLRNAVEFTGAGGRVLLHGVGTPDEATITVSDNGIGIAASDQTRVFDRFHRTRGGTAGRDEAIGLGLPLAKQFIEAHGGTIDLQSELGEGTTVTIRLPRSPA